VKHLTTSQELKRSQTAARKVFAAFGDDQPFRRRVKARLLVYPVDYTMLSSQQFGALAAAAAAVGERTAYLAAYGGSEAGWSGTYDHRLIGLDDFHAYKPSPDALILEHLRRGGGGQSADTRLDGDRPERRVHWVAVAALRACLRRGTGGVSFADADRRVPDRLPTESAAASERVGQEEP
jgi:hypothetical protein